MNVIKELHSSLSYFLLKLIQQRRIYKWQKIVGGTPSVTDFKNGMDISKAVLLETPRFVWLYSSKQATQLLIDVFQAVSRTF